MFKDGILLWPLLPQPEGVPRFSYTRDVVEGPLTLETQEPRSPHEEDANEVDETQTVPMGSDADGALLVPLKHHRVEAKGRFEGISPQLSDTSFKQILKRVLEKNIATAFRKIIGRRYLLSYYPIATAYDLVFRFVVVVFCLFQKGHPKILVKKPDGSCADRREFL